MLDIILLFVRLLLETKYRRLPVVDGDGKLVSLLLMNFSVNSYLLGDQQFDYFLFTC